MKPTVAILSLPLLMAVAFFTACDKPSQSGPATLTIYCAANLKKPVEAAAAEFKREFGTEVQLQFGGSGTLISQLRIAKRGDLYLAADDGSMNDARKFELVRETIPVARQHPVIAVRAGNPKNIRTIADLLRADVKVALANPEAASIGRVAKATLTNDWPQLAAHAAVMKPTVTEIASDLSLGAVDAAIVYDSTVPQFKGLEKIEVPEFAKREEVASIAVLTFCQQPAAALKFARYLAAPEKGGAIFKTNGFTPAGGDKWAAKPEMILYAGGLNRVAIEKALKRFADREGITITTVFNGCGILCATMKTMGDASNPKFPDAYYACDLCFVPPVAEQFPEAVILTQTDIGIAVKKGNPRNVKTLADLAQPNLKVGLCNAEQSTLGFMTRGMLKQVGLNDAIRKNVVVETPTADLLVTQLRAGALEAAIVYRVNAQSQAEHIEFFPIQHAGAKAVQPFAVRTTSPNAQLATRLLDFLKANRGDFEDAGFLWRGDEAPLKSKDIVVPDWLKDK
ncbi:MAG: molybdate ABC transporter substrate-binding protein [Verrucomicrobia bacterium]|nr:molybdate ABC transporter substrate-binding protein [Verrucomicrobiota bacterium]